MTYSTYPSSAIGYLGIGGQTERLASVGYRPTCALASVSLPSLAPSNYFVATINASSRGLGDPYVPTNVINRIGMIAEVTAGFQRNNLSLCVNEYPPGFDIQAYCFPFRPPFVYVPVLNVPAKSLTAVDVATGSSVLVSATAAPDKGSSTSLSTQSQISPIPAKNNALVLGNQPVAPSSQAETSSSGTRLPAIAKAPPMQTSSSTSSFTQAADPIQPMTTYAQHGPDPVPAPKASPSQPESTQLSQIPVPLPTQLPSTVVLLKSDEPPSVPAQGYGTETSAQESTEISPASAHYDASGAIAMPQIITADTQVFTLSPDLSSGCSINDRSLAPGSAITSNGILLSLPISGSILIAGSRTIQLSQAAAVADHPTITPPPAISSGVVIGGQYLAPGGMITLDGVSLFLPIPGSVLVAGGSTIGLEVAIQTISVGSQTFKIALEPHAGFAINGQTQAPGSVVTINDVVISLPTAGSAIIVGSSTIPLGFITTATAGSQTFMISLAPSGGLVIDSQTILQGQASYVKGIFVSLPIPGPNVIIGSSTITLDPFNTITASGQIFTLSPFLSPGNMLGSTETVTIDGQTFTLSPGPSPEVIINSQTLTPGEATTIDGIPFSLPLSGFSVTIGTSTIALSPDNPEIISAGSQALRVEKGPSSALIVDGRTITPGGEGVIVGITISLPTSGTDLVVGTSSIGLAPLIMSGFGINPTSTGVPNATFNGSTLVFTGGARRSNSAVNSRWEWILGLIFVSWIVGW